MPIHPAIRRSLPAPLLALLATAAVAPIAPLAAQKPALSQADYAKWEILGNAAISPDGKWVAYDFRRNSGDGELRWHAVNSDAEKAVKMGSGAIFTRSSRHLLYTISADTTGAGGRGGRGGRGGAAGGGAGVNNHNKAAIVDLRTGAATVFDDIQSFVVSTDGAHVALRRYAPTGRAGHGADLVVRDLDAGTDITLGNVSEYAWSDDGALLAMTIDVDGKTGNGVQLLDAASGQIRSLDASDAQYVNLLWRPHSTDLAAFRSRADSGFADTSFAVVAWSGLGTARHTTHVYDFGADAAFPRGMRVASYRRPQWDDDGSTLFFGIASREAKAPPAPHLTGAMAPARVEVWHWKDLREFHTQQVNGAQDRQRTELVAWHLAQNGVVRLSENPFETVQFSENRKAAIASDEDPYFKEIISGRYYRDLYRIDLTSGKRERIATKAPFGPVIAPSGHAYLAVRGGQWWYQDLTAAGGATPVSLTAKIKSGFVNVEDDHPVPERAAYGFAGWVAGEKSVIVYDRFDLWQVNVDGSNPVRLTRGREDSTVYRYVSLDPDVHTIDPGKPLTLSATGEWTKKSGYARVQIGQPAQRLVWLDKGVSRLAKAKDADEFLLVEQSYEESPNVFAAGASLADAKAQSHTNSFQGDYAWGKQVLLPYTNKRGDKLQMMLTYPANYQPGKKYPMVVYYYETLSNTHHQYVVPSERAVYNTTVFSQEGYFVLRPDIRFQARAPGWSGFDCVTSAVKTALATGMIDAAKVGNMGHSWGGYQSAFYAVHGKGVFAASIAGAPLTNLISMYGYSSGNTGQPETGHYETSQERMEVPLWEDPKAYISNSTVFATDSLQIPLLLEEGDADGNVNYYQSMELYNFGRRLGKNVVFLVYEGENHNVARPESQADYHKRQLEWFGHYLKGDEAPSWITTGETYLERQRILKEGGVTPIP
jgi:dipeptidyl aminopeptidase/acylaminoacyl peptidase